VNANIVHDRGFFVGNHPQDLRPQIERLQQVLDAVMVSSGRTVASA
jgi:CDP-6-deoxy-D-xylo-4-hexulose-3-dehydrase